jgi:hypothetical protein
MRLRRLIPLICVLGALPQAASAQEPSSRTPEVEKLNSPGLLSHWAFVERKTVVRRRPNSKAGLVGRLGLLTEDRTDELVLLLERTVDENGRRWVRVRVPSRKANTTGWVPQRMLGTFHPVNTWLKISLRRFTATLVKDEKVVFRARIGVGRRRWPTPRGEFYVRDRLSGYGKGGPYGPLAFGTSAKSDTLTDWPGGGVIGIHGTNAPGLIPGRISHGCIRMKNKDILRLDRLMPVGTPISIR